MTTFIVNGEEKELEMRVNGIDISGDFIGNTSHGMAHDEEGNYIASQEDFEWWQETIDAHLEMEEAIKVYAEEYGNEARELALDAMGSLDLEDQPGAVMIALEKEYGSLN